MSPLGRVKRRRDVAGSQYLSGVSFKPTGHFDPTDLFSHSQFAQHL